MANTLSTKTLRDKYRAAQIQQALRNAVVAEKVCIVDRTESKTISSPYITAVSSVVQAVAGTYAPAAITTTDDTLTVADEVIAATHIFQFEQSLANFDLFYTANVAMTNSVVTAVDKWVVNCLCEDGTGAYTTPAGGFTTSANVVTILSNIIAKVSGYADAMNGMYVIVENTDLTGIIQAQAGTGYSFSDAALNNGFVTSMLGVDIYVVRSGTFVDATTTSVSGSKTWTNSGHRVGGVKKVSTYAAPRGLTFEEKGVTGKTGMEVATIALVGFKQWTPTADLTIDITIA
jgi:hypothetical protein